MDKYELAAKYLNLIQRAGARHSAKDNDLVQQMHDRACDLGAKCQCEGVAHPMLKAAVEALILRHGTHDQKAHGRRHGVGGLKEFAKKRGYQVREVKGKGGKTEYAITNKQGDKMRVGGLTEGRKLITSARRERKKQAKNLAQERKLVSSPIARAIATGQSLSKFSEKDLRKTYLEASLKNHSFLTRKINDELRARQGDFSNFSFGRNR